MKWLSNTLTAAILAVVLTAIVAVSLKIPFFKDKESQTRDEMMLLCYHLHAKFAPLKPDSHLVFAPIDEQSLKLLGAWPFNRAVHGSFLQVLAPESPKAVGWDIFFTEAKGDDQDEIHLDPNRLAKYDTVAKVLSDAQRLGATKIGFVHIDQYMN